MNFKGLPMPNILIIDDYPIFCDALAGALAKPGYVIRCAGSAAEGLMIMADWSVDVVITDYEMPEMDGINLINRIRTRASREQQNSREAEQPDIHQKNLQQNSGIL